MKRLFATLVVAGLLGVAARESEASAAKVPLTLDPLTVSAPQSVAKAATADVLQVARHGHYRGGHHGHHQHWHRGHHHHHHGHWHGGFHRRYYAPPVYYPPVYSYPYGGYPYGGSSFGIFIGF
jgi:hypothetical protein